jgi:hypothetical protein
MGALDLIFRDTRRWITIHEIVSSNLRNEQANVDVVHQDKGNCKTAEDVYAVDTPRAGRMILRSRSIMRQHGSVRGRSAKVVPTATPSPFFRVNPYTFSFLRLHREGFQLQPMVCATVTGRYAQT